jgi:DNA modification methylase
MPKTQQTFDQLTLSDPQLDSANETTLTDQSLVNGKKKANELDGKTWTQYSISIWSDIRKTPDEIALGHPAIFPVALVMRLIKIFTNNNDTLIFDPFAGIGSTVIGAQRLGKNGVGIELSPKFAEQARNRCNANMPLDDVQGSGTIIQDDSLNMMKHLEKESVDLVITSPPYWDILTEKRSADGKEIRNYGDDQGDLGRINDYREFLQQLKEVFTRAFEVMRDGAYCCVVVMDLRKKEKFFPFHSDIASFMQEIGFIYDDIIIWDRRQEYNNFRPLGYPSVFRVNKAHEFILIFQKPKGSASSNGTKE